MQNTYFKHLCDPKLIDGILKFDSQGKIFLFKIVIEIYLLFNANKNFHV